MMDTLQLAMQQLPPVSSISQCQRVKIVSIWVVFWNTVVTTFIQLPKECVAEIR